MSYRTHIHVFLLADHYSLIPGVFILLNSGDGQRQLLLALKGSLQLSEGSHVFTAHYDDYKPAQGGNCSEVATGQRFHSSTN